MGMDDHSMDFKEAFIVLNSLHKKRTKGKKFDYSKVKESEEMDKYVKVLSEILNHVDKNLGEDFYRTKGVFRLSPSEKKLNEIKKHIENDEELNYEEYSVIDLSSTIKFILRDKIDGLFDNFILEQIFGLEEIDNDDADDLLESVRVIIEPKKSKIFIDILEILAKLSFNSIKNKMSYKNLAIIFCPVFIGKTNLIEFDYNEIISYSNIIGLFIGATLRKMNSALEK